MLVKCVGKSDKFPLLTTYTHEMAMKGLRSLKASFTSDRVGIGVVSTVVRALMIQ